MVLIIVFAPSGLPTPYCKSPAHLTTDSNFAAVTDSSAKLWREDILRSGLWPPVGLASGVICPALRYCGTEWGTEAAATCAATCTNKLLFPAREPKSYQCSARMPSGPRSLSRGILRRVSRVETLDLLNSLLCDWDWCVSGKLPGLVLFRQYVPMWRLCVLVTASAAWPVLRVAFCTGAISHSARTMAQSADQSSAKKSSNRASRKSAQLFSDALTAGRPRKSQLLRTSAFQADSDANEEGLLRMMARRMAC